MTLSLTQQTFLAGDAYRMLANTPKSLHARLLPLIGYQPCHEEFAETPVNELESTRETVHDRAEPDDISGEVEVSATFGVVERIAPLAVSRGVVAPDGLHSDSTEHSHDRNQSVIPPRELESLWQCTALAGQLLSPLGMVLEHRQIDLPRAVTLLARQEVIEHLPRKRRTAQNRELILLIDRSSRAMPLWPDLIALAEAVTQIRGADLVRRLYVYAAKDLAWDAVDQEWIRLSSLNAGAPLLAIVVADTEYLKRQWRHLFRTLNQTLQLHFALLGTRKPNLDTVDCLVRAMARTHLPKPERLRALAASVYGLDSPVGAAELMAVWNYKERCGRDFNWALEPGVQHALLQEYRQIEDSRRALLENALRYTRKNLPPEAVAVERSLGASVGIERPASDADIKAVIEAYRHGDRQAAENWLKDAMGPLSIIGRAGLEAGLWHELIDIAGEVASRYGLPQPGLRARFGYDESDETLKLVATDCGWRVEDGGSWTGPMTYSAKPLWRDPRTWRALQPGDELRGNVLLTDHYRVSLSRIIKPEWADEIEHRREGTRVKVDGRWIRWFTPSGERRNGFDDVVRMEPSEGAGFWWDDTQCSVMTQRPFNSLDWIGEINKDSFGMYSVQEFKGITVKFRWIPPGSFHMGSPETERGRFSNELKHKVVLSQGFWLSDTPCTQALWEAVTGRNPSQFKHPEHPVENVSWNDIQKDFLPAWNKAFSNTIASLPTEAQWEYACRAGNRTPFHWGHDVNYERARYLEVWELDSNDTVAQAYKYRERLRENDRYGTAPVYKFDPNDWGIFQMHGNVWEWCSDGYGDYPRVEVIDPVGTKTEQRRVLRGGSWGSNGRFLRAASRGHRVPDSRSHLIGFRLSQVPTARARSTDGSPAEQGSLAAERR